MNAICHGAFAIQGDHRSPTGSGGPPVFRISGAEFPSSDRHEPHEECGWASERECDDCPVTFDTSIRSDRFGERVIRPKAPGGSGQRGGPSRGGVGSAVTPNHGTEIQSLACLDGDENRLAAGGDVSTEFRIKADKGNGGNLGETVSFGPERLSECLGTSVDDSRGRVVRHSEVDEYLEFAKQRGTKVGEVTRNRIGIFSHFETEGDRIANGDLSRLGGCPHREPADGAGERRGSSCFGKWTNSDGSGLCGLNDRSKILHGHLSTIEDVPLNNQSGRLPQDDVNLARIDHTRPHWMVDVFNLIEKIRPVSAIDSSA